MISSEKFLFLHLIKLKCWMKKSVSAVYKKYQPWSQSCFDKEEMLRTWANCPLPVESTDLICYLVSRTRSTPKCNKSFGSLIRLTISIQVIKCCWASFPTCKNYQLKLWAKRISESWPWCKDLLKGLGYDRISKSAQVVSKICNTGIHFISCFIYFCWRNDCFLTYTLVK